MPSSYRQRSLKRLIEDQFTPAQKALAKAHGTPAEFAMQCYLCVPSDISMDEAEAAVQKYRSEFHEAGRKSKLEVPR